MPEFPLPALHHFRQTAQRRLGINRTGRIIRRIDQNCRDVLGQILRQSLKINLEIIRLCRDHTDVRSCSFYIRIVFRKVRCKDQNRVSRLCHSADCMRQRAGCAGRRKNMLRPIVHAEPPVQRGCHFLLHLRNAEARAVAMETHRIHPIQQPEERGAERFRRRDRRVAETEIKNIIAPDFRGACRGILRQLPDHRFMGQHCKIGLIDHDMVPSPGIRISS